MAGETTTPGAQDKTAATQTSTTTTTGTDTTTTAGKGEGTQPETLLTSTEEGGGKGADDKTKGKEQPGSDGKKPDGTKQEPAAFEPKLPEGFKLDPEDDTALRALVKESKDSGDLAQKLLDLAVKREERQLKAQEAQAAALDKKWVDEAKADPEIGGEHWPATLAAAKKTIAHYAKTPEEQKAVSQALRETRAGNHPALIKLLSRIGADLTEDRVDDHGKGGSATKTRKEEIASFFKPDAPEST